MSRRSSKGHVLSAKPLAGIVLILADIPVCSCSSLVRATLCWDRDFIFPNSRGGFMDYENLGDLQD
jgi:hypothetical protein